MQTGCDSGVGEQGLTARVTAAAIADELERVRGRTVALVEPLSETRLARQIRPFMSPLIWDIGHIGEFERRWLVSAAEGVAEEGLDERFDAAETPRADRGELPLPPKAVALRGLEAVRAETLTGLGRADLSRADPLLRDGYVYRMVMQHEAQHQETMLQSLDIPAADWAYDGDGSGGAGRQRPGRAVEPSRQIDDASRVLIAGGAFALGARDRGRAYDNEREQHEVHVEEFEIERYPVSNRRWVEFIRDGGYRRAELWSPAGQAWLEETGFEGAQGWVDAGEDRRVRRFGGEVTLDDREPVQHVCYWEAEAFARWCGARLPSEREWEKAAAWSPDATASRTYPWGEGTPAELTEPVDLDTAPDTRRWRPPYLGDRPQLASALGVEDLLGSVYQWTVSEFRPYPGFEAFPYAEYSEVFFGDTYRVLRGSSWATDTLLWRNSYRNWDLPQRRQLFAGVRLVYDA